MTQPTTQREPGEILAQDAQDRELWAALGRVRGRYLAAMATLRAVCDEMTRLHEALGLPPEPDLLPQPLHIHGATARPASSTPTPPQLSLHDRICAVAVQMWGEEGENRIRAAMAAGGLRDRDPEVRAASGKVLLRLLQPLAGRVSGVSELCAEIGDLRCAAIAQLPDVPACIQMLISLRERWPGETPMDLSRALRFAADGPPQDSKALVHVGAGVLREVARLLQGLTWPADDARVPADAQALIHHLGRIAGEMEDPL